MRTFSYIGVLITLIMSLLWAHSTSEGETTITTLHFSKVGDLNDQKFSQGPLTGKRFLLKVPRGLTSLQIGFASRDQHALCHMLVQVTTPLYIGAHLTAALKWYNADPADRYTRPYEHNYPPRVWARCKQTAEGETVTISYPVAGDYYIVMRNTNKTKTATYFMFTIKQ